MAFSSRLKALREAAGLSQEALANKVGMSVGGLRHLEQGINKDPKWSTVQQIAKALGVSTDELMNGGDDEPAGQADSKPAADTTTPPQPAQPKKRRGRPKKSQG